MSFGFKASICNLPTRDLLHILCYNAQMSAVSKFLAKQGGAKT